MNDRDFFKSQLENNLATAASGPRAGLRAAFISFYSQVGSKIDSCTPAVLSQRIRAVLCAGLLDLALKLASELTEGPPRAKK
jgi:hypothetical protein